MDSKECRPEKVRQSESGNSFDVDTQHPSTINNPDELKEVAALMPKLVVKSGTPPAQEFELKPGKNYVGRGFACDLKLEDGSVSSSHALIEVNGAVVTVTDLGSTNGTRINGLPATGSPLQSGHVLRFGAVELIFIADGSAAPPANVPATPASPAAKQIATEFIIREPSHIGVATTPPPPVAPAPAAGELKIPGAAPKPAQPPPPVSIPQAAAPAPVPVKPAAAPSPPATSPAPPAPTPASEPKPVVASSPPPPVSIPQAVAPAPVPVKPAAAPTPPISAVPQTSPIEAAKTSPPPAAAKSAAPVAPPIEEFPPIMPAAPLLVEPPPGKIFCKFHSQIPGRWLCQKCGEVFCPICVEARPVSSGIGSFCRKCGTQCVAVKPREVEQREAALPRLDNVTLLKTLGLGSAGAVAGIAVWIGIAAATGFDQPIVFAPLIGIACGSGVKIAGQDRPGKFFSLAAAIITLIGAVAGKCMALLVTHQAFVFAPLSLALGIAGLAAAMFAAWKIGGGDF